MRKALLIISSLAIVAVLVGVVGPRLWSRTSPEPGTAALGEEAPQADQTRITGQGTVIPVRWARLSFPIGGRLEEINATVGMTVTMGQALATLEREELELQVRLAESELQTRQVQLAELQQGVSQVEIAAAQANCDAELAAYQELRAGPSEQDKALAQADLGEAERALQRAQASYDAVSSRPDIGSRPEAMQLEEATFDYQRAKVVYEEAVAGPSEAALKQAYSRVASAQAQLEALTREQPQALRAAEAAVTRAEAALEQAQLRLEQAALYAPFDAMITSIADIRVGDNIEPGVPLLTVADLAELQVEITDLDEWGAANVSVDQTVDLIVPALNNRNLRGHVSFVSSEPTVAASGAVFYRALVALDEQNADLRWGNSVRIRLYVAGAHGVGFR